MFRSGSIKDLGKVKPRTYISFGWHVSCHRLYFHHLTDIQHFRYSHLLAYLGQLLCCKFLHTINPQPWILSQSDSKPSHEKTAGRNVCSWFGVLFYKEISWIIETSWLTGMHGKAHPLSPTIPNCPSSSVCYCSNLDYHWW